MDYQALAGKLTGHVITPNAAGYDLARRSYNPLFDTRRPAAIAQCANTSDVQACVDAAVASHTPIAARSGGHSYAGYSTPDNALVVDLTGLSGVRVDGDTAVVGAGTRLIDVYAGLAAAGRCLPAGSCPSVGVAGLTLGGGIGVLSRKYGLTCDRLVGATVVTADGRARTVSADSDPDLFWALRGGGGGNFGIVTSFTFDTDPAPNVTAFSLRFPAAAAADVLAAWQQWVPAMIPELWSNLVLSGGSPVQCRVGGCYVGGVSGLNTMLNNLVTSSQIKAGFNWAHYSNPEIDAAIPKANAIVDATARTAAYEKITTTLVEDAIFLPLWNVSGVYSGVANLAGVQFGPTGYSYYHAAQFQ